MAGFNQHEGDDIAKLKTQLEEAKHAREKVEKELEELRKGDPEKNKKHRDEVQDLWNKLDLEKQLTKELEEERELQRKINLETDVVKRADLEKWLEDKKRSRELEEEVSDLQLKINSEETDELNRADLEEQLKVKKRSKEQLKKQDKKQKHLKNWKREERLAFNLESLKEEIEKQTAEPEPELEPKPDSLAEKLKKIEEGEIEEIEKALEREFQIRKQKAAAATPLFWQFGRKSEPESAEDIESQLGDPKLPECYEEIRTLLLVEQDDVRKKALDTWEAKSALFTKRVERKKNKVGELKNEVYQLIGFFSVFQGVVLTAVSQSNLLHCNNLWSPILLSVLASIVTVAGVIQKLNQISDHQKTVHSEERSLKEVVARVSDLKRQGQGFRFSKFLDSRKQTQQFGSFFLGYSGFVIITLGVFTLAFPISHWRILCDPGHCP